MTGRALWGLAVIAILLATFGAVAGAAGKGKKKAKAKAVPISGKLQSEEGTNIDAASSISMTVIVKRGEPRKIRNVSLTFSYECADGRTGIGQHTFPGSIPVDFEPGRSPDRVDFQWDRGGFDGVYGDVTRKGNRAFGQVFVGPENAFCANNLSYFTATK